ncbi:hypothetical protein BKA70DRAFT_1223242 [Coprinopsis sp. MPI-PUGE-AT-0042]|nr:hypothetical protein BKA70DRAFT_1223242 [Coprinopsis sp. MPI-PUGE-AT-0042]
MRWWLSFALITLWGSLALLSCGLALHELRLNPATVAPKAILVRVEKGKHATLTSKETKEQKNERTNERTNEREITDDKRPKEQGDRPSTFEELSVWKLSFRLPKDTLSNGWKDGSSEG